MKIQGDPFFLFCTAGSRDNEPTCGRPLGIRVGPNGTLLIADAYLGLFEVNATTGESITTVCSFN